MENRGQFKGKRFLIPEKATFLKPQDQKPMIYPDVRLRVKARDGREGE